MVAMAMGDEDGGRWRQPLKERRAAGGIDVERLGAEAQRQAGMADRMDREIAGRGRNDIGRRGKRRTNGGGERQGGKPKDGGTTVRHGHS